MYQGRFQDNGACGYVLKPAFLRDPNSAFHPRNLAQGPWWTRKRLTIRVRPAQRRARRPRASPPPTPSPSVPSLTPITFPQVITGQQLPKVNKSKNSIVDPKVTVEVHGVPRDTASRQTAVVTNNGACRGGAGPPIPR